MIRKKVKQVTGNSEGVTFTKQDKELLDDLELNDTVEIRRVKEDDTNWKTNSRESENNV